MLLLSDIYNQLQHIDQILAEYAKSLQEGSYATSFEAYLKAGGVDPRDSSSSEQPAKRPKIGRSQPGKTQ